MLIFPPQGFRVCTCKPGSKKRKFLIQLFNIRAVTLKDYVSCRFACPDAARAPSSIANTLHLARCAYFRALPLGRGQRASTVVFSPPRGVNSPRITHHSG